MALDHFVSQVHLKNFYSPLLGGKKMYGIKKRTLECFPCGAEDVCRITDGSTNQYLEKERCVEDFLKRIEPNYNQAIGNCRSGIFDTNTIFAVAGFASYILACAPAAMRLNSDFLAKTVESTAVLMDRADDLPPPPKEFGGRSLTELIENGTVIFEIDGKYPQALGIAGLVNRVLLFGNSDWEILINEEADSPFFTSDFPIAIEQSEDPRILNRIIPLAPNLAVRIRPKIEQPIREDALKFQNFRSRSYRPSRQEVGEINRLIVRCAEEQVYYSNARTWVLPFVQKNAGYWIEPVTARIPAASGELIWSSMRIARRQR